MVNRDVLASVTIGFTIVAITTLAIITIYRDPSEAKDILNVVLPVFASWVGTVLAFYFGRENFEAANQQVREIIQKLTPEQRAKKPVISIMRKLDNMTIFRIIQRQDEQNIKISELLDKFGNHISRLPIISAEGKPLYMIHQSKLDRYIIEGRKQDDSLETLVSTQGFNFGLNQGFVVVSEKTSLSEAKIKMEEIPSCQDIFITKEGNPDAPITGWISNIRMAKFLEY